MMRDAGRSLGYSAIVAVGVITSLYLAYVFLDGFLFERGVPALVASYTIPFFTVPIYFFCLWMVHLAQPSGAEAGGGRGLGCLVATGAVALVLAAFAAALAHLLVSRSNDFGAQAATLFPLLFEIVLTLLVTGRDRQRRTRRQVLLYCLWVTSIFAGFIATGAWHEWFGYPALGNDLALVYCGILFHLANAVSLATALRRGR